MKILSVFTIIMLAAFSFSAVNAQPRHRHHHVKHHVRHHRHHKM